MPFSPLQDSTNFHMLAKSTGSDYLFFCPDQDEPAYCMVLETTFRNQGSQLSSSTMIPKMTVVADLTHTLPPLGISPDNV